MALKKAKVITVTSVKGGTGKSTFVINLAGIFSQNNLKTIIVDLDLSGGAIAATLNKPSDKDVYTLAYDLMNNRFDTIDKYVTKYDENIDILPAPNDPRTALKIHYQYIENFIRQLEYKYDIILIDTSHQTSAVNSSAFDNSDYILYILNGDLMDLKNMKTMISIYEDMDLDNYKTILNVPLNRDNSLYEIEDILGKNIDYVIPKNAYIENLKKYVALGQIPSYEKGYRGKNILNKIVQDIVK